MKVKYKQVIYRLRVKVTTSFILLSSVSDWRYPFSMCILSLQIKQKWKINHFNPCLKHSTHIYSKIYSNQIKLSICSQWGITLSVIGKQENITGPKAENSDVLYIWRTKCLLVYLYIILWNVHDIMLYQAVQCVWVWLLFKVDTLKRQGLWGAFLSFKLYNCFGSCSWNIFCITQRK